MGLGVGGVVVGGVWVVGLVQRKVAELLGNERFGNQFARIRHPIERDKAAHARSLVGTKQRLIQSLEPVTQILEAMGFVLADLVNRGLQIFG